MALMDRVRCFEMENRRNFIVSIVSGFIFALAWWLVIDAAAIYSIEDFPRAFHTPGVFATVAFIMVNIIPHSAIADDYSDGFFGRRCVLFCVFTAFFVTFSCVIASAWLLFGWYVAPGHSQVWPGIAVFFQNVLLCTATLAFRFGRKSED